MIDATGDSLAPVYMAPQSRGVEHDQAFGEALEALGLLEHHVMRLLEVAERMHPPG